MVGPEKKKNKFGKYGSQAGSAAASGVGFGAGKRPFNYFTFFLLI
jgi:hypothetical protein